MISATRLAEYLIYVIKERMKKDAMDIEEFDVTPSRLQKLLYYCQVYSMAFTGSKIFSDPITIKENRPFIESVYQKYKDYDIVPHEDKEEENFDDVGVVTSAIAYTVICDNIEKSDYALAYKIMRERPWPESLLS